MTKDITLTMVSVCPTSWSSLKICYPLKNYRKFIWIDILSGFLVPRIICLRQWSNTYTLLSCKKCHLQDLFLHSVLTPGFNVGPEDMFRQMTIYFHFTPIPGILVTDPRAGLISFLLLSIFLLSIRFNWNSTTETQHFNCILMISSAFNGFRCHFYQILPNDNSDITSHQQLSSFSSSASFSSSSSSSILTTTFSSSSRFRLFCHFFPTTFQLIKHLQFSFIPSANWFVQ